ncbi:P-loop containing nucleoside triphosphate hydrolase protein [Gonapodya prolifera JEL478]|uniref:p-loop containing nucleoside triphosphate hydrolase protein n=1 Tax=Gonapodya prolifera (strain JEL478) TaxID=1344416 RepID=A0A139AI47_GONPJ|nr:P-loop containing nucleoside triphosphate hydrolase protein [Gonapodya prolifera JEL478]|eukprot:KXS16440.1 P-loop containing nucleoside triphosphate hydrolase protein [Gonapodya prolifera JEL478]
MSGVKPVSVSTLFSRRVLEQLVQEAQRQWVEVEKGRTSVYVPEHGQWRQARSRPIRSLSTVVLEDGVKEMIIGDVMDFLRNEKWYAERGIPYRRGYLFHGKPGTGKTSFITALAGHFRLNVYFVSLAGTTDESLLRLLSMTPKRCILLIEDVDVAFVKRDSEPSQNGMPMVVGGMPMAVGGMPIAVPGMGMRQAGPQLTFSGFLNAIDGVSSQEGRILCMTTNHIELLDAALIRPGRVDLKVHFDNATLTQARELFWSFYSASLDMPMQQLVYSEPGTKTHDETATAKTEAVTPIYSTTGAAKRISLKELAELADQFSTTIPERTFSPAELQLFLMKYKNDPTKAIESAGALVSQ